jgi:hypothetical protein
MIAETRRLDVVAAALLVVCAASVGLPTWWHPTTQPHYSVSIVLPPRFAPSPPDISSDPRTLGSQREVWSRGEVIVPDGGGDEEEGDQDDQGLPDDVYDI